MTFYDCVVYRVFIEELDQTKRQLLTCSSQSLADHQHQFGAGPEPEFGLVETRTSTRVKHKHWNQFNENTSSVISLSGQ